MANTLLQLKTMVANHLGSDDGGTATAIRDTLVNRARQRFYGERKWSFCLSPNTTVTITAQLGTLPSTFNLAFDPECVYTYTGNQKYEYTKVEYNEVNTHTTNSYVYAIDKTAKKIYINQTTVSSVLMDFYQVPADAATDGSADSTNELAPDISAIGYLAIAYWWLGKERATSKYQLFYDMYKEARDAMKSLDVKNQAVKPLNLNPLTQGYNARSRTYVPKGYIGQR